MHEYLACVLRPCADAGDAAALRVAHGQRGHAGRDREVYEPQDPHRHQQTGQGIRIRIRAAHCSLLCLLFCSSCAPLRIRTESTDTAYCVVYIGTRTSSMLCTVL